MVTATWRNTYFGGATRDRALCAIARLVILDRETHSENEAWCALSDWEKRHYVTCAEEKLREQGRL